MEETSIDSTQRLGEALKWVGQRRHANPEANTLALVDEAGRRFKLSQTQQEWLVASLSSTPR